MNTTRHGESRPQGIDENARPERHSLVVVCRTAASALSVETLRTLERQAGDATSLLEAPPWADEPAEPWMGRTVGVGVRGAAVVSWGGPGGRVGWIAGVSAGDAAWTSFVMDAVERLRRSGPLTVAAHRLPAMGRDGTAVLAAMADLQALGVEFVVGGFPVPQESTRWAAALCQAPRRGDRP